VGRVEAVAMGLASTCLATRECAQVASEPRHLAGNLSTTGSLRAYRCGWRRVGAGNAPVCASGIIPG
jgi:hypothetical protein